MPENIEILPIEMVVQAFPARPAALPDVRDFVRRQLTGAKVSDDDVRIMCERVVDVLLDAAGAAGTIQVSLRIFPHSAEVDVLFAPDIPVLLPLPVPTPMTPAAVPPSAPATPQAFSAWLSGRLRQEGLTMEAAARR